VTSSWFFLSTRNYDARSATHQISYYSRCRCSCLQYKGVIVVKMQQWVPFIPFPSTEYIVLLFALFTAKIVSLYIMARIGKCRVYTLCTVYTVYTVYTVRTQCIHCVHSLHSVHSVHSVHTVLNSGRFIQAAVSDMLMAL